MKQTHYDIQFYQDSQYLGDIGYVRLGIAKQDKFAAEFSTAGTNAIVSPEAENARKGVT